MQLSAKTSSIVDWSRVNDSVRLVLSELGQDRGGKLPAEDGSTKASPAVDPEIVRRAFQQANEEFRRALDPTRRSLRVAFGIVISWLALAISGVAISFLNPWGGGVLSVASLGTMSR
jgi:hypothetical protein